MARPVERLRQIAQERWSGATVHGRGRNWIRHQHPSDPRRFMLDASVGPLHYGDAVDQEIDTAWQPTSGTWQYEMLDADYQIRAKEAFNGAPLLEFADRVSGETVTFQPRQLEFNNDRGDVQLISAVQGVLASVDDATLQWVGAFGSGLDFKWVAGTAFLNKVLSIDALASLPAPTTQILTGGNPVLRLQWQMSYSTDEPYVDGVQWSGRQNDPITTFSEIEFRDDQGNTVFTFKPARVLDSSLDFPEVGVATRISRSGPNMFVEVRLPWTWLETAVFPVYIDPTVEPQVAASADDSWEDPSGANYNDLTQIHVRTSSSDYRWGAFRVALNVANAATIDNATISVVTDHPARDTLHADVLAEDVDSAVAFTGETSHITGRIAANPTTATYNWTDTSDPGSGATLTTPNNALDAIVQEVVDRAGWSSGNYIAIFLDPSAYDTGEFLWARSYDDTPADAPLLHVEYTEGGTTYNLSAVAVAASNTTDTPSLDISREMVAVTQGVTATPDTVGLGISFDFSSVISVATSTPDTVTLLVVVEFSAQIASSAITPDVVVLDKAIDLTSAILAATATNDTVVLDVARSLASVIQSVTSTNDSVALDAVREFIASILAATATPDNAILASANEFLAQVIAATSTPDTVAVDVARELAATILAATVTPDAANLTVSGEVQLSATISAASNTNDTVSLSRDMEFTVVVSAASNITDVVLLDVLLEFLSTISAATVAPDTVVLSKAIELASQAAASSNTTDVALLDILREVAATILAATSTNDTVDLTIGGEVALSAAVLAQSNTPDALLGVQFEFVSVTVSATTTNDNADLTVAADVLLSATILASTATPDALIGVQFEFLSSVVSATATNDVVSLSRALSANAVLLSQTITNDTPSLALAKALSSNIIVVTAAPDIASIGIAKLFLATLLAQTSTNDSSTLLLGNELGEMLYRGIAKGMLRGMR